MKRLDKIITCWLNRILVFVAGLFLMGMIGLTSANIILRGVWVPIRGTYELMGLMGAVVTAFALGYTQIKRGHISVNVLINRFPGRIRSLLNVFNHTVCGAFFSIAAWKILEKAAILKSSGEVTETLRIIYHSFTFGVALGCVVLAMVFFVDLIQTIFPDRGRKP